MYHGKKSMNRRVFCALAFGTALALFAPMAATAQGIALGQADLIRQLRETGSFMKEYASTHDHYPNSPDEMDSCLKSLYKRVSMTEPDSRLQVQQNSQYRTFYQFAIGIDPSYKSIPIINGIPKIPDSFVAPASMIVIMTDGQDEVVGWAAGVDGKPIAGLDGQSGAMHFYNKIEPKDQSSTPKAN